MFEEDAQILSRVADILKPEERLSVAEWADRNRILNERYAAEPGPFRIARTPYMIEPYEACADPRLSLVVLIKSAQVGGTEFLNNVLLYRIDQQPCPIIYALPTEQDAGQEATGRLRRMIEDCPATRQYIPHPNFARPEALTLKGPRTIFMGWAGAPRTMTRKAAGMVLFDEVDNIERAAGRLGQHIELSEERVTTFGYQAKTVAVSTPSTPEGAAWQTWLQTDRREYQVPCPHCGAYQALRFERIKWPENLEADEIEAAKAAAYKCAECGETIGEGQRMWMVRRGVWVAEKQKPAEPLPLKDQTAVRRAAQIRDRWQPELAGPVPVTRRRGYRIWSAYSPWRSFSAIAARFLRARADRERLRVFVNAWLAEPFVEIATHPIKKSELGARRINSYARNTVPNEMQVLGVGVDTQDTCFFYEVRAWGYQGRSALITEGIAETFDDLDNLLRSRWPTADGSRELRPLALAIDSGGSRTKEVYEYGRQRTGIVYPVKGVQTANWSVMPRRIAYDLPNAFRGHVLLFLVNTEFYKDALAASMRKALDGPEAFLLHREASDEYLAHLTAEHKVQKPLRPGAPSQSAKAVWVPKASHRPNHWLDAAVYGMAIADFKRWTVIRRPEAAPRRPAPPQRRPPRARSEYLERHRTRSAGRSHH